jgi:hypothetical protein
MRLKTPKGQTFVEQKVTVNRRLVGWLALLFLIGAVASFVVDNGDSENSVNLWQSIFTRVGVLLGTLWLALPKDGTLGKWAEMSLLKLTVILVIVIAVVRAPQQLLRYLPILLALAAANRFLRPREQTRPPRAFQ